MAGRTVKRIISQSNLSLILSAAVEDTVSIWLTDGCSVWTGEVQPQELEDMADNVGMTLSEFLIEANEALTTPDSEHFIFQFKVDTQEFVWKKLLDSSGKRIKITLGSVPLYESQDHKEGVLEFVMNLVIDNRTLRDSIRELEREKALIYQDKVKATDVGDEPAVLNAKKMKIRQLQDHLDNLAADKDSRIGVAAADVSSDTDIHENIADIDPETNPKDDVIVERRRRTAKS